MVLLTTKAALLSASLTVAANLPSAFGRDATDLPHSTALFARADSNNQARIIHQPVTDVWDQTKGKLNDRGRALVASRWTSKDIGDASWQRRGNGHRRSNSNSSSKNQGLAKSSKKWQKWHEDVSWGIAVSRAENDDQDNEFLVEAGFGTPRQTLKVVIDSGSPDVWVYSPQCCYASNHTFFDPSKSRTYGNRTTDDDDNQIRAAKGQPGTQWSIAYGSGSQTSGYVGLDTVAFNNLAVQNISVALATNITGSSRAYRGMEGIVGIQPARIEYSKYGEWNNPFEQAVRNGQLKKPYLTATFVKANRRTGRGGGGRYTFGSTDDAATRGSLTWVNTTSANYWGFSFDAVKVGSKDATDQDDPYKRVIIDTGSALNYFSDTVAASINAQITGAVDSSSNSTTDGEDVDGDSTPYLVPCRTGLPEYENQLPRNKRNKPFSVTIAGRDFQIPVSDFVFWPLEPQTPADRKSKKEAMCLSAFQPTSAAFAVLGDVFLKNHVVTFDTGTPGEEPTFTGRRIGFGDRRDV